MWLSYRDAFVSVVVSRRNPREFEARTRNLEDAENLSRLLKVPFIHTPRGDYEYRLILSRRKLKRLMLEAADTVDYRNFKATMLEGSRRAAAHHDAWWAFLKLRDGGKNTFADDYIYDEERPDPYLPFARRDVGPPRPGNLSVWDRETERWVKHT